MFGIPSTQGAIFRPSYTKLEPCRQQPGPLGTPQKRTPLGPPDLLNQHLRLSKAPGRRHRG